MRASSKTPFRHTHTFLTVRKIRYSQDLMATVNMATMTSVVRGVCRVSTAALLLLLRHKSRHPPRYYSLLSAVQRSLASQYYEQYSCLKLIFYDVFLTR